MQFKVPQFIEIEDKIIGPLTLKQFFYLGGGAMLLFILWFFLTLGAFILVALPVAGVSLALAFYKVNGRPLINVLVAMIRYLTKPRLYLWRKKNE
jgi:hypothetical protein